jgi:hypothetical protein
MKGARRNGLILAAAALLVALVAFLFRGPLLEPLLSYALHRTLGLNGTIASVGGSILSDLELRGITARGEAGSGPLVSLAAERVSARYVLTALLRGRAAFLDTLEVTVEGARVDVDLTRPRAAAGSVKPAEHPAGAPAFPRLPRLTVRNSQVKVSGQGSALAAEGLHLEVARPDREGGQTIQIDSSRFTLRHPAVREREISLSIQARSLARGLAITSVKLNGDPFVESASLELGERPGDLDLRAALRLWQGSIEIGMTRRPDGANSATMKMIRTTLRRMTGPKDKGGG